MSECRGPWEGLLYRNGEEFEEAQAWQEAPAECVLANSSSAGRGWSWETKRKMVPVLLQVLSFLWLRNHFSFLQV